MFEEKDLVNQFADLTGDNYWIHTDPEKAKTDSPFGTTIAHGFLTLSLLSKLVEGNGVVPENTVMGLNYGFVDRRTDEAGARRDPYRPRPPGSASCRR